MRMSRFACAALAVAMLGACSQGQQGSSSDEMRKQLDQLVQTSKDTAAQTHELVNASKSTNEALKGLVDRVQSLEKSLSGALAQQKRGALLLTLEVDATCDNDEQCVNTARATCNRINYPNAVTLRFTPGIRPTLHSLVCFD